MHETIKKTIFIGNDPQIINKKCAYAADASFENTLRYRNRLFSFVNLFNISTFI